MSVSSPSTYIPPQVTITEIVNPSVTPDIVTGTNLCIIGVPGNTTTGISPITVTDTLLLGVNASPVNLPTIASLNNDAVLVSINSVTNVLDPSIGTNGTPGTGYQPGVDYSVQPGISLPDGGVNESVPANSTGTITPLQSGAFYATTTLATALTTSSAITTLTVTSLKQNIPQGTTIYTISSTHVQSWVLESTANIGDTTLTVVSQTPSFAFPIGTIISTSNNGWIPTLVNITYTYTPSDYWNPVRMSDVGSIQARFGNAWSTEILANGQTVYTGVNSPLSLAAAFALQNGASSVILQPLFILSDPTNPNTQGPAIGGDIGNVTAWQQTLQNLRRVNNIDVIVPVVGYDNINITNSDVLGIFEAIQAHIAYQNTQNDFMVSVFGEDGTYNAAQYNTLSPPSNLLWTHASALGTAYGKTQAKQNILLNTSVFNVSVPGAQGGTITIGGQYAAAAVGGALVSRSTSSALTRQFISGFSSVVDSRTPSDKNNDAGNGLFVLENYNGGIRCRQGITLDIWDGSAGQEISVVRSQFVMIESIQQTLDSQIIGQIIANGNSPMVVETTINAILTLLQSSNIIVGFTGATATLTSLNPTTVSASFSYQPAFPLNYINITFNLNLTAGTISSTVSS